MSMWTVTFYSYKGGVGRSFALSTTARQLAREGAKVFVLDLDLEAPGQHFKFHLLDRELAKPNEQRRHQPGFLEFAWSFLRTDGFPQLTDHVSTPAVEFAGKGELRVMTAGGILSRDYWEQLSRLRWGEIVYGRSDPEGAGPGEDDGVPFFLVLKELIEEKYAPDILLIDARTGITEVGEIALTLLADQVVFLFAHNQESLWGTREVMRGLRRSEVKVDIIPVLTRYPLPSPGVKEEAEAEEALKRWVGAYLNEAASDLPPLGLSAVHVLHSDRELEKKEELREGSVYLTDFLKLYEALGLESQLGLSFKQLRLEAGAQEAQRLERANELVQAERAWRHTLELLKASDAPPGEQMAQALRARAKILITLGTEQRVDPSEQPDHYHDEAAGLLTTTIHLESAPTSERASAAREYTDLLLQRKQFELLLPALQTVKEHQEAAGDWIAYGAWLGDFLQRCQQADGVYERKTQVIELVTRELIRSLKMTGDSDGAEARLRELLVDHHAQGEPAGESSGNVGQELAALRFASRASPWKPPPTPPTFEELPPKRPRGVRGGDLVETLAVPLELVTPLLGGAVQPRTIDHVDIIRAATLRGHLRFWWRALFGGRLQGEPLYQEERRIWGGASDDNHHAGGRSAVELRVTVTRAAAVDSSPIRPYGWDMTPGAYALFPARGTRGDARNPAQEIAPRRQPGTRFLLELRCPASLRAQVEATVRALLLFGGYGARTRRGLGSLTVSDPAERARWLPARADRQALCELFGTDVLAALPGRPLDDLPLLAGAGLRVGPRVASAQLAWITALGWLNDFRQGQPTTGALGAHVPTQARDRGDNRRPGRSNWPEADKVRRLAGRGPWAHPPLHNATPAWPRAGFGLPIISQFQRRDRNNAPYRDREPEPYELRWLPAAQGEPGNNRPGKEQDRLASPLIVKALPLADGSFVPCALWLYRGYPAGQVLLRLADPRSAHSAAPFDLLVAPGDQARFQPLAQAMTQPPGRRLRAAFFTWLSGRPQIQVVSP